MVKQVQAIPSEGDVFGKWVVSGEAFHANVGDGCELHVPVRCDCGFEKSLPPAVLTYGNSTQCRRCADLSPQRSAAMLRARHESRDSIRWIRGLESPLNYSIPGVDWRLIIKSLMGKKIKQSHIAHRSGCSQAVISQWANGRMPSIPESADSIVEYAVEVLGFDFVKSCGVRVGA